MPPPRPIATVAVLATTLAATYSGCSVNDPYDDEIPSGPPWANTRTTLNEVPTALPELSRTPVTDPEPTPAHAVERFAEVYVNWDYRTLAGIQRRLAAMSVGEASAMHARAAARTPSDYELRRGRVANHGRVVSLAPIRPARRWTYVVVTVERTTGARVYDDLRPAHHVTLATAQPVSGGWAISRWEPQT